VYIGKVAELTGCTPKAIRLCRALVSSEQVGITQVPHTRTTSIVRIRVKRNRQTSNLQRWVRSRKEPAAALSSEMANQGIEVNVCKCRRRSERSRRSTSA
jgi:ribosomal protein S17